MHFMFWLHRFTSVWQTDPSADYTRMYFSDITLSLLTSQLVMKLLCAASFGCAVYLKSIFMKTEGSRHVFNSKCVPFATSFDISL